MYVAQLVGRTLGAPAAKEKPKTQPPSSKSKLKTKKKLKKAERFANLCLRLAGLGAKSSPQSFRILMKHLIAIIKANPAAKMLSPYFKDRGFARAPDEVKRGVILLWRGIEELSIEYDGMVKQTEGTDLEQASATIWKQILRGVSNENSELAQTGTIERIADRLASSFNSLIPTIAKQIFDGLRKDRPKGKNKRCKVPKSFAMFRKQLATVVKRYDAGLAFMLRDVDSTGDIISPLRDQFWNYYINASRDIEKDPKQLAKIFVDTVKRYLSKALLVSLGSYRDPDSYLPQGLPKAHLRPSQVLMLVEDFSNCF
jgi:hypothetical protein